MPSLSFLGMETTQTAADLTVTFTKDERKELHDINRTLWAAAWVSGACSYAEYVAGINSVR